MSLPAVGCQKCLSFYQYSGVSEGLIQDALSLSTDTKNCGNFLSIEVAAIFVEDSHRDAGGSY